MITGRGKLIMIPQDIKDSFNEAILVNKDIDGEIDWYGVGQDMFQDLMKTYDSDVIDEAMNMLADIYEQKLLTGKLH
jgi:hypothetical protein